MENSYGIGITNRFSLLIENESDPSETTIVVPDKDSKKTKSKVAEKENKGKPEAPAKGKPQTQVQRKPAKDAAPKPTEGKREEGKPPGQRGENKDRPDRPFTKFNSENREERNNRRNREDRPFNGNPFDSNKDREDRPPRRENAGGDFENRRGRGGLGNRGPRGGAGPRRQFDDRRGKREFDRQSGSDKTGVKPVDKRDGAGAHNWGTHKDDIEDTTDTTKVNNDVDTVWNEAEKTDAANTTTESKEGETEAEPAPVEEEPKELTLDEWKAQRAGRQKPQYNLRKAGEGEDQTQWKKMYELNKKKAAEGEQEEEDDEEYDNAEYPQRVGRQKHVIGIDFHFNDSNRRGTGGRGRGTRGAGRGGRPRENRGPGEKGGNRYRNDDLRGDGGGRDDYHARNAPKVDDERAFPSLG